jgi:predicted RND superfamily exporter protein
MGSTNAPTWVTNAVALVVAVAWLTSLLVGALEKDWTALTITTPVMLLLAGYAFGIKIIQRQQPESPKEQERWSHLP